MRHLDYARLASVYAEELLMSIRMRQFEMIARRWNTRADEFLMVHVKKSAAAYLSIARRRTIKADS